ncbi:MAG: YybS family protein [Proteobacteria bacterium]|nr:YybS family protein [Pseudomonadota bacterium]
MEREKGLFVHSGMIRGIAVLSLTLLIVALIPFVGPVVIVMTPLPIIFFFSRLGRARGLAALAVAFIIVSGLLSLLGHRANIAVLSMIGFTGVMLSEVLQRRYSIEKTFIIASLALFFCGVGFVLYAALLSGTPPWRIVELYIGGIITENLRLYEQLDISADQIALVRENAQQIAGFFTVIFPALALSGAVLTVWLNVLSARSLLRRHAEEFPDFGDLSLWKAPDRLVWLLIAAGGMMLVPIDVVDSVGLNILIVCCLIYLLQGLAIVGFFFKRKRVPLLFRWLFYMLIAVQQYMVILVIAFGLFDIWVDFRKRIAGIKDVPA